MAGPVLFGIGLALTLVFLVALVVEKRTGRAKDALNDQTYKIGVLGISLLGPVIMMIGIFVWGVNIWVWFGILIVISFIGFLIATWFVGSFMRMLRGTRIINTMIAIELFGLMIMLLGLLIFLIWGGDGFAVADALLSFGLLCAIPAAIYLIAYYLSKLFERHQEQRADLQNTDPNLSAYNINVEGDTTINNFARAQEDDEELPTEESQFDDEKPEPEEEPQAEPEEDPELAAQKQKIEEDLEAAKRELEALQKKQETDKKELEEKIAAAQAAGEEAPVSAHSDDEHNRLQSDLASKIAQLEAALRRVAELENEKKNKYLLAQERRKQKAEERKRILSRENIIMHIGKYFVETAACFMMNRDTYKDKFGLSPYNRLVISKNPDGSQKVTHTMTNTEDKLYRFSELLVDAERFLKHPQLMPMFVSLVNEGTSLVRISEKIYIMYVQFHRRDFVKDYRYKEDFENLLILVSHNLVLQGVNFGNIFTQVPFNVKTGYTEENILNYLNSNELREKFTQAFPRFADLGFENIHQAMVIAFIDTIKTQLPHETLAAAILKDGIRMGKTLERMEAKDAKEAEKAERAAQREAARAAKSAPSVWDDVFDNNSDAVG